MVDANEITKALHLWFAPGDVFEVRVLDAVTREYRREHVESGYFDFEHIQAVPEALNALMSYRGVYVTVNPVNPDLLARAVNRIRPAGKNPTTTDADVICRRWLLIDCDAERPSGVSSSDKEHEAAVAKAEEVRAGLATLGWSEPLMMDSGNGAQLMYRIDLPTQDDSLVQKCVASIAAASSAEVKIDLTVHNAARIWRLPGTMNCKGDSIPSRPHRMAHILHAPDKLEIITQEQLQSIVISDENYSGNDGSSDGYIPSDFNIDQWISDHCPELGQAQPWKGGRRWIFPVCPFNDAHNNKSAVLIEQPSGAIAFKCHHNGCVGNDWQKLRELKEPGCYDRPQQDTSGVDLSGLLSPQSKPVDEVTEKKEESLFPNPGPLPDKLLSIPGFIDDVVNLSMATAPYPNRVLSFTGALAFLAFLVGRKVQDRRDNRSNVYLISLADSGTGKDHPRKVNFNIGFHIGVTGSIGDAFSSGEGLEDALFMHPSMLFQADEFDCIFNTMKYSKDARGESINEKLLKFYGAANTIYPMRKKAIAKKKDGSAEECSHIINPNLVVLGTAIPKYFYESLSKRVLENGLVARCIIIEAGKRGEAGNASPITPSDSILRAAKYWAEYSLQGNLSSEYPRPLIISESPEASAMLKEVQTECDKRYSFFESKQESGAMALWARAFEKVCKLAMLHGISTSIYSPQITKDSVKWAWKFVDHLTRRMLFMAHSYIYENVFEEKCRKVIRALDDAGGSMGHSALLRKSHESNDVFKKVIETLYEAGNIEIDIDRGKTKPSKIYRLVLR